MFQLIKGGKKDEPAAMPKPIPTSSQDWPHNDETWAEFMARTDYESRYKVSPFTTIICTVAAIFIVVAMATEALDKAI